LRPGEKLFEELSHEGENITSTHHPKIMRFVSDPQPLAKVKAIFENLSREIHRVEPGQLKLLLKEAVPEYKPYMT
jgi:FlaA1/EpsC-like NDP-sugar epimerase